MHLTTLFNKVSLQGSHRNSDGWLLESSHVFIEALSPELNEGVQIKGAVFNKSSDDSDYYVSSGSDIT